MAKTLFLGVEGSGKTTLAMALTRAPELNAPLRKPPLIFRADAAWRPAPGPEIAGDAVLLRRAL